jgi:hypothetical protein
MPIDPCGVHVRLHADIVTQADGMPSDPCRVRNRLHAVAVPQANGMPFGTPATPPASLPAAPLIPLLEGEKNE